MCVGGGGNRLAVHVVMLCVVYTKVQLYVEPNRHQSVCVWGGGVNRLAVHVVMLCVVSGVHEYSWW